MFYLVLFGLFFYLCSEQAVIGWLVTYFKDTGFLKDPLASLTTTIQWTCVLFGRLTVAYLSRKIDKRKIVLKDQIKTLGIYDVTVKLHPEVQANIKVEING